ncbi:hypothetical protein DYBT9275_00065 [Dyadobacter sp. CECT 9275]|uniref:TANFOR domain-containing protein n=1 Tax=Dyadobacter helix TaxID=2822344 RepID=A0A916NA57_9BACT|nr:hypothetical protein [Dyadobacter sp. CECT 9275]CAG4988363.1 hypothetical protein DYBT9275_00065 [Dyadobacter sp. CECT 9275]
MEFHSKESGILKGRIIFTGILWFLCMAFHAGMAQNQVRITTNVLPPYSPYIQDYPGTGNRVQVFISNLSGRALSVRLLGKLEGDNGVVIRTSLSYRPLRALELRPTDVNRLVTRTELEGLFDLGQIEVQGMNKDLLYRGMPLPEGNYQLCVQAFDNATTRPLSGEFPMGCSGLIPVRIVEPPILISPQADEEVTIKTPQTQLFTWTAPVGVMPNQVEYSIRIIELPETNTDPNVFIDAVVLPRSGIEINNLRTTTFVYGPQHPPLQKGKRYAWRVQAKSVRERLHFMNDGKSPVQSFTYGATVPAGVDLDYITIIKPAGRRNLTVEVGNNNPFEVSWKLDDAFEKILRKAFEAQPRKSIVEQFSELSYRVQIKTADRGGAGKIVMDRMIRAEQLSLQKSELPADMPTGKNYQVIVELQGMSALRRKRAELGENALVSKPRSFLLIEKNKGNEADSLTIRGLLAYRFPGESGAAHPLPYTRVVLMKVFPNKYRGAVAYGKSDAYGNYTIKVHKTALHGASDSTVYTRCLVDPVNPFIQPIAEAGYYQNSNENTFQIASSEQGTYDVQGITWLATGYTLDVTAKQSYKNWPGAPDVNLEGKHLVLYRKPNIAKDYDKYRLPYEGQSQGNSSSSVQVDIKQGTPFGGNVVNDKLTQSVSAAAEAVSGSGNPKTAEETLRLKVMGELKAKGYEFMGMAVLQPKGTGYGAQFYNLLYAGISYDAYQMYCPDCELKPDDADPVVFMKPKEKLPLSPARIEKYTYQIQTTEPPTMTFTGKLTYKFADAGLNGAQIKALGYTQVHLQVVYRNTNVEKSTFSTSYGNYGEFAEQHQDFSQTLDTKITAADGSFTFTVKMTKAMQLGVLPPTEATGSGEFFNPSAVFIRGIRVVVDNPYYTSPTETYGLLAGQQLKPQGSYDFGPVVSMVRSYTLVTQIKSDTTGISLVNKQKADIKSDLFGIRVSVLRAAKTKVPPIGPNRQPPADEGAGTKPTISIQNQKFTVVATEETNVNGIARFPRMVMANGESDAYFIATQSSLDGLNNYNLVTLKRITAGEEWGSVYSTEATQEEKERSDHAKKTQKDAAQVNCKTVWELWYRQNPNFPNTYTYLAQYTDEQYEEMKAEMHSPEYSWKSHYVGCQKANNYWLGDKLHDVKINNVVLLTSMNNAQASAQFVDQYKTFDSDVVKRFLAPGDPVVNLRVVDKANPTQGIKNAVVKLTYIKNGAFMNIPTSITQYTGEDGWILKPFQLSPGTNAKVRIQADGYVYFNTIIQKASAENVINIGEVLLGQNSYYPAVLMEPNTEIHGRAIDADALAGPLLGSSGNVYLGDKSAAGKVVTMDKNAAEKKVSSGSVLSQPSASVFDNDYSLEAYVQADDGNMVKTKYLEGSWKFALRAPSTSATLKIFPVNTSYFGEERNIKTQLPKPIQGKDNLFSIQAGDINVYERDHRITFKLLDDISGKEVTGAYVRLFGKHASGYEFGPSKTDGVVEARFKNVSIENLYVEIAAPGFVTRTVSIKNEESKKAVSETVRLQPARTVKGIVVMRSASGIETPLQGAEVFVAAGGNAPLKYSTVSAKDGSFSLDVSKTFDGSSIKIEATFDPKNNLSLPAGTTFVGASSNQLVPQPNGQSLKLTVTTFDKFSITSLWGFPVTIEKIDPKTMQVTGEVDLSDSGLGPFAIMDKNVRVRFKNVPFKADPQNTAQGIPASETVELDAGLLNNLLYHTSPDINFNKAKYNIKLTSADGLFGKLKIVKTPGASTGRIIAKAQVVDNSFNFSANLLSYEKGQFFLYDPDAPGRSTDKPVVTAFDAAKSNIKWTNFGISQENGAPMKLKLLDFDANSKLEGSRLIEDEIHLSPVMTCKVKNANPSELKVSIGDLVLKNNTVDAKTGETPLTFPLAGKWGVEIRDWNLDFKKGGFYSKSGVVKTGKADIPIKEFNLRSDFYSLIVEPAGSLELAGVASLKLGGKAYFGYDPQTGSDMKGHWAVVVVPNGQSPAAVLPAKSVPGLTQDMEFATFSLLDNGEDVVSFGSGSKTFRYFDIIDVRPTTIETGSDYFAFDSGMSSAIPNAPQDVSMRFIYSRPQGSAVKLTTKVPGGYKLQTKGYLNFEAGQYVAADKSQTTAIFFADGVMAIRGSLEEPGKLLLDNVLLVHNKNETHITHGRNVDLTNTSVLTKWKTSLSDLTDPAKDEMYYNEGGDFKRLRISLGGNSGLSKVYCHQSVSNKQWELLKFSGLPQGFSKMLGEEEKNRLGFTAYGEIKAEGQKIKLDGIDTGMGGLNLVYDHEKKRLTGSMQLSNIPVPPTMTFANGMAQVRLDGNGFYMVASGELQNVPLIVPVTMRAGLMLGVYTSNDLGEARQILFANSHRKELPCSFTSGFKGMYAIGEIPVPIISSYKYEMSVPGVGGYKVGMDAYVDGYVFGNYDNGSFAVGGGMGIAAHAYAYGSVLSLSAGGEIHVNGGVDTKLAVNPGTKSVSVSVDSRLSAGFSVTLTEDLTGLDTGTSADFCLKLAGTASYTIGSSPDLSVTPDCSFTKCDSGCLVKEQ